MMLQSLAEEGGDLFAVLLGSSRDLLRVRVLEGELQDLKAVGDVVVVVLLDGRSDERNELGKMELELLLVHAGEHSERLHASYFDEDVLRLQLLSEVLNNIGEGLFGLLEER